MILEDDLTLWWKYVLNNHKEEARQRALSLIEKGKRTEAGCIVTGTEAVRKVRFHDRQVAAYRFIYCTLNEVAPSKDDVVRHKCHERTCINPDHLEIGSRADNKHDDWAYGAYGIDPRFI
jgi:hypothetical protein